MTTSDRSVLDGHDHTACAGKIRQPGYNVPNGFDAQGRMTFLWVEDTSTGACKYDRKAIDSACIAAKCERGGHAQ